MERGAGDSTATLSEQLREVTERSHLAVGSLTIRERSHRGSSGQFLGTETETETDTRVGTLQRGALL